MIAVAFAVAVLVPAMAFADTGDSPSNADTLTVGVSTPGTLIVGDGSPTTYAYVYKVDLTAGQTIVATYTTSPSITSADLRLYASFPSYFDWLGANTVSSTVHVAWLQANKTGTYYLAALGEGSPGTFTLDTAFAPAVKYSLSSLTAPKTVKRNKTFKVKTTLIGEFDQFDLPVKFMIERKVGKKFKTFGSASAHWTGGGDGQHLPLFANIKLTKKGTYRIRARFSDAAHATKYNAWRTVTVK